MVERTLAALCVSLAAVALSAERPRITGIAHVALYVSDLARSRAFYEDFLGYQSPFSLKRKDSAADRMVFIKINDRQYIELSTDPPREGWKDGQLSHISFETEDANAMRDYLAARGVKVPDKVGIGQIGNANFNVTDPDGHTIEIVQYMPGGWSLRDSGKLMPETRISNRILHAGVLVRHLDPAMAFYRDILGFREFWRGKSAASATLSWVNMRVPDGEDYLEFMLYTGEPSAADKGVRNHICLEVPDVQRAVDMLKARPAFQKYGREIEVKTGVNRRRQANLFDPDGTRIELMEPDAVDGKPAPSSNAPPPE